jgi:hypothetical protein
MDHSEHASPGLTRTALSEAGLLCAFAMRAVRLAFQPPFELREVVRFDNVTKSFDDDLVLDGVSFGVPRGTPAA